MDEVAVRERWAANAAVAGIEISNEEMTEILDGGLRERLTWLEQALAENDWNGAPPDYLGDTDRRDETDG